MFLTRGSSLHSGESSAGFLALTYYSSCLSLYQTQLFSLLPKQIESLITFHQPAQATAPDQYTPPLSFHHICHSPLWNTLPTHKTNHPGSTCTLFLPLRLRTAPSAHPDTDSHLTGPQQLCFCDEDDPSEVWNINAHGGTSSCFAWLLTMDVSL